MAFLNQKIDVRLRDFELNLVDRAVSDDYDIKDRSQFVRVAVIRELRSRYPIKYEMGDANENNKAT